MAKKQFDKNGMYIGSNPLLQGVEKGSQRRLDKKAIVHHIVVGILMLGVIMASWEFIDWFVGH